MSIQTTDQFDVIVAGGGPAGSTAAYTAAKAGLKVCLVDKKTFPRDKLCGGLLTERSSTLYQRIFGRTLSPDIAGRSDHIAFFAGGRLLTGIDGYSQFHATMRRVFDAHLVSLASEAGATMALGDGVHSVQPEENTLRLTDGRVLKYGVLIGADGVSSVVARTLFGEPFDRRKIGFGLEVEVPRSKLSGQPEFIEIDFAAADWGYGWVFPKPATYTIGVAGIHRLNPDLRARLSSYLALKNLDIADYTVKGQYIPYGDFRKTPGRANVLLAGDAAQVVDPITGEGIAYAMQTGQAAAEAAVAAVKANDPGRAFALYMPAYEHVASDIRQANWWRYLIFPRPARPLFAWAFADASTLQRGYLDIMAGRHEYKVLFRLFPIQIGHALRKLGRWMVLRRA